MVKYLPEMQERQVPSLGWEDPLEKEVATHSSILAWRIPWTEESGGVQSMGSQRVRHDLASKQQHFVTRDQALPNLCFLFNGLWSFVQTLTPVLF